MLSLEEIRPFLLVPNLTEGQYIKAIAQMSEGFTTKRDKIGDYTLSAEQISAYSMLYLPTNMPKLDFLLNQLPQELIDQFSCADLIDFGCGPGTYSLAWLQIFGPNSGSLHLIDSSQLMLDQAANMILGLYPKRTSDSFNKALPTFLGKKERKKPLVLLFGHSLNEIGIAQGIRLIDKVDPDYIIVIEPGTKSFFLEMLKLRSQLIDRKFTINYPCANSSACPMVKRQDDWCHGVLKITHAPDVERLSQLVSLDRRHLPFVSFVFSAVETRKYESIRYLQFVEENKFSFLLAVCMEQNGELRYRHFEILKRHLNNQAVKKLRALSIGSELKVEIEKKLTDELWRVKLI